MHHINQLKSVIALAQHRHFGRAADAIGLTQSALSQNIQKLEAVYGVKLFERRNKQVSLTDYGEVVLVTANSVVESIKNVQREIRLLQNLETSHLIISVDPYLASSLLAPALATLLREHPKLRFTATESNWEGIEKKLMNDEVDIHFGITSPTLHRSLSIEEVEISSPLILCAPHHPLTKHDEIDMAQAINFPVVTPTPPEWYIKWALLQVEEFQNKLDVNKLMFLHADNIGMVKRVASQSHAITAALASDAEDDIKSGKLSILRMKNWPLTMQACIVTKESRSLPPAAKLLIQSYKEAVDHEHNNSAYLASTI